MILNKENTEMSRFKITVGEKDIKYGKRRDMYNCPVARAICKTFKIPISSKLVQVWSRGVDINEEAQISNNVTKKIERFDKTGIMKPFSFYLDINYE